MADVAMIQSLVAVVPLGTDNPDEFTNAEPFTTQPSGRAVFGGLLLSQAIMAAAATVPSELQPYSSQSSFLRPAIVKANERVSYQVERVYDGRSSATRLVRAIQDQQCVYLATISFQRGSKKSSAAAMLQYSHPPPELDGLHPDQMDKDANKHLNASAISQNPLWQMLGDDKDPFDWRPFGFVMADEPWECRTRGFTRLAAPLRAPVSPATHIAALAYNSDYVLLGVPLYANPESVGAGMRNVSMAATLSHTLTFHEPNVKADEWVVVERETSWAGEERALIRQRMWSLETGRLVLTCTQEAMIRLRGSSEKL